MSAIVRRRCAWSARRLAVAAVVLCTLAAPAAARAAAPADETGILVRLDQLAPVESAARVALAREGIAALGSAPDPAVELPLRRALSLALADLGRTDEALTESRAWQAAALARGTAADRADAAIGLAWAKVQAGDYDGALAGFMAALGQDGLHGLPHLRAVALHGIGRVHGTRGDFALALPSLEEARDLLADAGDDVDRGDVLCSLGIVDAQLDRPDEALASLQEAIRIYTALGAERRKLVAVSNLATFRDNQGDHEGALAIYRESLDLADRYGKVEDRALARLNVGEALLALERPAEAVPLLRRSVALADSSGAGQTLAWAHQDLSTAYEALGDLRRALDEQKAYVEAHQAFFDEQSDARIAELQTRYESAVREGENEHLRGELALRTSEVRRSRTLQAALAAGGVLLLTALGLLANRNRSVARMNQALAATNLAVSRQKQALEELQANLETRVRERTAELMRVNGQLQVEAAHREAAETQKRELEAQYLQSQKMEAVGLLAGGVAHDFNNIMTGIGMTCELALSEAEADPARPGVAELKQILDLVRRAGGLTRQLLAFSRQQVLRPRPVDLDALVALNLDLLRRLLGEDVVVVFTPGATGAVVTADPNQVEQVLVNLAVNARDAMPDGGPLALRTERRTVAAAAAADTPDAIPPGEYVVLTVADRGTGIDPAVLPNIFDPFFTTKAEGRGTGLGLATVYGIVRQHGAHIAAESAPGRGTTFTIHFPAAAGRVDVPAVRATVPAEAVRGDGGAVLVLEDDENIRELIRRLLELQGFTVFGAGDGDAAEALLTEHGDAIRLLISDVVLPGRGGVEFYREVVRPRLPAVRALFISGYPGRSLAPLQEDGADGPPFLAKPFNRDQLLQAVAAALAG